MILESSHAMLWLVSQTSSAKADFELLELQTALWCSLKLTFCLTQIYFLAITALYRVYSMCFRIGRNAILGFRLDWLQLSRGWWAVKGFAIIPYIQGNAEPIRRVLNNCGIKVALKPFRTLGHIFAKPEDRVPTDRKTHAVYSKSCGDCEKVYLGQTKRQICTGLFLILTTRIFTSRW